MSPGFVSDSKKLLSQNLSLSLLFGAVRWNAWDGRPCVRADDHVHHGLGTGGGRTRIMEGPCQKGCGASVLFRVPSLYTEGRVGVGRSAMELLQRLQIPM